MPNFKSVVYFLVVYFGEGCCRSRSSSCDRGKIKSTPSPFDLDWNGLGLEFDNTSKLHSESKKKASEKIERNSCLQCC